MGIAVVNQTKQLLIITLNSGKTLYVPPGKLSEPVDHLEVNDNAKIAKLLDSGAVTIVPSEATQI
jgi:hypothetical protein